jgi:hypothetical protein
MLVTFTAAPFTTAPVGSVTVPTMTPLLDCAQTFEPKAQSNAIVRVATKFALFIIPPSNLQLIIIGAASTKSCSRSYLCVGKCYSRYEMGLRALAYSYLVNN